MKKLFFLLTIWVSLPIMAIAFVGFSKEVMADGLYNAREEFEYTPHARMERQDEQMREIQFQQYQQQQYMQHEKLMEQQSMYNQAHRNTGELARVILQER